MPIERSERSTRTDPLGGIAELDLGRCASAHGVNLDDNAFGWHRADVLNDQQFTTGFLFSHESRPDYCPRGSFVGFPHRRRFRVANLDNLLSVDEPIDIMFKCSPDLGRQVLARYVRQGVLPLRSDALATRRGGPPLSRDARRPPTPKGRGP